MAENIDYLLTLLSSIQKNTSTLQSDVDTAIKIVQSLNAKPAADDGAVTASVRLKVPWIGQNTDRPDDDWSKSDCGSACLAMVANYLNHPCSVDDVSIKTGRPRNFLALDYNELIAAASRFGITLHWFGGATLDALCSDLDHNKPVIVLVNYKDLPSRYDLNYNAGHYIVIVGYDSTGVIYHDPYFDKETQGAFKHMTRAEFMLAYSTKAPANKNACHSLRLA
jgi:hypothetical protein